MKTAFLMVVGVSILAVSPASAYDLRKPDGTPGCAYDGTECIVYCDSGERAGSMYWNGSVWTDGVRSDADGQTVAEAICAANGTSCT